MHGLLISGDISGYDQKALDERNSVTIKFKAVFRPFVKDPCRNLVR